jgi:hypothetical protein
VILRIRENKRCQQHGCGQSQANPTTHRKNKTFSLEATSMSTGSVTCRIISPQACLQATNTTCHFRERQTIEQSYIFHNAYASQLLSTMFPPIDTLHSCGTHRKSRKGPSSMSSASFLCISCEICFRQPRSPANTPCGTKAKNHHHNTTSEFRYMYIRRSCLLCLHL